MNEKEWNLSLCIWRALTIKKVSLKIKSFSLKVRLFSEKVLEIVMKVSVLSVKVNERSHFRLIFYMKKIFWLDFFRKTSQFHMFLSYISLIWLRIQWKWLRKFQKSSKFRHFSVIWLGLHWELTEIPVKMTGKVSNLSQFDWILS